jgi:glycosyltransferase involved in cell wall biosynthesis
MNPATGGPCQGIRNSVPELEKLNVRNEVVTLDDPADSYLGTDPFPVHALGPAKNPWNYSSKLLPWLKNNVHRFDAVIIHGSWLYAGYAVNKLFRQLKNAENSSGGKKKPKLVLMPHGMLDPYFQKAENRKLKAIRNWIYWKVIESKIVNSVDAMFFTTEAELKLARLAFQPYKPTKEINVGYGVPAPPVYNKRMQDAFLNKSSLCADQPYFLFLSRIHEKKGVDLLIKAYLEIVATTGKGDKPHPVGDGSIAGIEVPRLVIAGPGLDSPYGEYLLQLIAEHSFLKELIIFPGMLTGDAKWGGFYGCQAFILPSHQENFGIAVVEALACSRPVLISNQVNIWHEIQTHKAGLVAPDTLHGTFQLLKNWLHLSEEGKKELSENALSAYNQCFSIKPAARHLLEVITSLQQ